MSILVDFHLKIAIFHIIFPGSGSGKFPGERGMPNWSIPRDSPGRDSPGSNTSDVKLSNEAQKF